MPKIMRPVAMERCIGCYSCMLACARLRFRSLSWSRSGIHIRSRGGLTAGFEAHFCLACLPAPCALSCPSGALTQRPGGGVRNKAELCLRCGNCLSSCPADVIVMDRESGYPLLCVHCGRCVKFCPHGCLAMVPSPAEGDSRGSDY